MEFELTHPLDDALLEKMGETHKLYGMQQVRVLDPPDRIRVLYDASRLTPAQVEAALHRAGIPARRS